MYIFDIEEFRLPQFGTRQIMNIHIPEIGAEEQLPE
jgi:hypothetical protein